MDESETITLDLETALRDDDKGAVKDIILERLRIEAESIDQRLKQGVSQDVFVTNQKLRDGYDAARQTVENIWRQVQMPHALV